MRMALVLVMLVGGVGGLLLAEPRAGSGAAPVAGPASDPKPVIATLERHAGGHFVGIAEINGHPVRVLVDTGATMVALTEEDARGAGLSVDPSRWKPVARTASGEARGEALTLASLSVGGIKRMDVSAAVVENLPMSLLGQSFLRRLEAVEIRGDTMTLR